MNITTLTSVLIYTAIGIALFIIGYHSLTLLFKKHDLNKAIDNHNYAAGIAIGGFLIAVGIIISGSIQ